MVTMPPISVTYSAGGWAIGMPGSATLSVSVTSRSWLSHSVKLDVTIVLSSVSELRPGSPSFATPLITWTGGPPTPGHGISSMVTLALNVLNENPTLVASCGLASCGLASGWSLLKTLSAPDSLTVTVLGVWLISTSGMRQVRFGAAQVSSVARISPQNMAQLARPLPPPAPCPNAPIT